MKRVLFSLPLVLSLIFTSTSILEADEVPPYLANPFTSSLEIIVDKTTPDISDLNNVKIFGFTLDDKAPSPYEGTIFTHGPYEEIQVRRMKFTQEGTIKDTEYSNLRLVNLDTGYILQTIPFPIDKKFEFNLEVDPSEPDFGVLVSWHRYAVFASIDNLPKKRTMKTFIKRRDDINAYDYRNDVRVALISKKLNRFPIKEVKIKITP